VETKWALGVANMIMMSCYSTFTFLIVMVCVFPWMFFRPP